MKNKILAFFGIASAMSGNPLGSIDTWKPKRPKAAAHITKQILEDAKAKREAREKRVADRMLKCSPEHKFKHPRWYQKSYEL